MRLTFGMNLDGARWSRKRAETGQVQLGPLGMLSLLEGRLGLAGPATHPANRINQYMNRLKELDFEQAWFHGSFQADSWSTAKQMLAWRDELISAGWDGSMGADASPRLSALSKLENAAKILDPGIADRLQMVIRKLMGTRRIDVSRAHLLEDVALLPPEWRVIFSMLQRMGVEILASTVVSHGGGNTNLSKTQSAIQGDPQRGALVDDESLLLIQAPNEWDAAEALALWLSANRQSNENVAIICEGESHVLDLTLRRHGLPKIGASGVSRWREALQILPLVIANAWKPVDVRRLSELLALQASPIPLRAARLLMRAIAHEPGVGGEAWAKALEAIESGKRSAPRRGSQAQPLDLSLIHI